MTDTLNAKLILSIEHDQRIDLTADGAAVRGYETYIREYVGMLESGLMARMSNAAYKTLHALALRARILGDPRRPGAEEEYLELERLGIVSQEDKGNLFCFPSREQLILDTGMGSVHTIDSALDELVEMKIVKRITPAQPRITRGLFGSNVYIIHPESFIGKFATRSGEQKLLPVDSNGEQKLLPANGTGSSLRNTANCSLKSKDRATTILSLRESSPEIARVIEFYAQAIGAERHEPAQKEIQRIAALLGEGFTEEQIRDGITRAVNRAREKGRTANLTFCIRAIRSVSPAQSEIVPDNGKSSTGQIVTGDGKASAQIVPVASKSYAMLLDGLELDEPSQTAFVSLIALVEEHSQRPITKAEARRWKVLSDDFKELAVARAVRPIALIQQAVEEALDAGSARDGYCAPKLARSILSRWAKVQENPSRRRNRLKDDGKQKSRTLKREIPIAVQVYRDVRRRFPAQELWDGIAKEVGTDEPSLAFWRETLQAWVARGYNPMNVKGPLDWFKQREIPQNGSSKPAEHTSERRPVESLEVIQARMEQNAMAGEST